MRVLLLSAVAVMVLAAGLWARSTILAPAKEFSMPMGSGSLYDLKVTTLDGKPADLSTYKGKVALVVNVASQCGFTPQYAGLEKLYRELAPKGVVILGFPSNDFGGQEPGTAEEIGQFCQKNYGVTFPMFAKVVTKKGPDQSPVYSFLGESGSLPQWNFSKYVVDKNG
jgi:glutathione peroxidase